MNKIKSIKLQNDFFFFLEIFLRNRTRSLIARRMQIIYAAQIGQAALCRVQNEILQSKLWNFFMCVLPPLRTIPSAFQIIPNFERFSKKKKIHKRPT